MKMKLGSILALIAVLMLNLACAKEDSPELGGHFIFELRSDKALDRLSLVITDIEILEGNNGVDLDYRWESVKESGAKRWRSSKLLYGSYRFDYTIKYEDENGRDQYFGPFDHVFQIFPGEETKFSRKI